MTSGQEQALKELRAIERAATVRGGALEIVSVLNPGRSLSLVVDLSVSCEEFLPPALKGLPLNNRERVGLTIPVDFPFRRPDVCVPHDRFAGFPHVQWSRSLCLYQAPDVEWNPSDGMYGFIARLSWWLQRGAMDELDETGAPMHPPVAYPADNAPLVVVRENAPTVADRPWLGRVRLKRQHERIELGSWIDVHSRIRPPGSFGAAVMLHTPLAFEYPNKAATILTAFERAGVPIDQFIDLLKDVLLANPEEEGLFVAVGAPGRGVKGSGILKQHITVWRIDPLTIKGVRLSLLEGDNNEALATIGASCRTIVKDWFNQAPVDWCKVTEQRPEIVTRRDARSPLSRFQGKRVAMWGCGAVGGAVAELLARADVKTLFLYDQGIVTPGLIVRQNFIDADIGKSKVSALSDRLSRIRPDLEIKTFNRDILNEPLGRANWAEGVDVVIDTTASDSVSKKLESQSLTGVGRVPVVSIMIGHEARNGVAVIAGPRFSGAVADLYRRVKLATCERTSEFADEFWPTTPRTDLFQPEPGCSSPTFVGSYADVSNLASTLLNLAAPHIDDADAAKAYLYAPPRPGSAPAFEEFSWRSDRVFAERADGLQVRFDRAAERDFTAHVRRAARLKGAKKETGGLLFGEMDTASGVIWISEVSGAPPDSDAREDRFVCGTVGTVAMNEALKKRSRGSVAFIGTWHTHPGMRPDPSGIDLTGMRTIVCSSGFKSPRCLLMIAGGDIHNKPDFHVGIFDREQYEERSGAV